MKNSNPDAPVSLQEMLDAREKRGILRQRCFTSPDAPSSLIQISINMPGAVKNSPMIRDIYGEALRQVKETFPEAELLPESSASRKTGPEGYYLLSLPGDEVKRKTCFLEDNHILGRLWDLDVYTAQDQQISRSDLGLGGRLCYLCGRSAHECSRSRKHSLEEIHSHIGELYRQYSDKSPMIAERA